MLLIALVAFIGLVNAAPSRVGSSIALTCPNPTDGPVCIWATDTCSGDTECASGEKCCATNCGKMCQKAVMSGKPRDQNQPQNQENGNQENLDDRCPVYIPELLPNGDACPPEPFNHCSTNDDCSGKICCKMGCGITCLDVDPNAPVMPPPQPVDPNAPVMPPPQPVDPNSQFPPRQIPSGVSDPGIDSATMVFLSSEFQKTGIIMNGLAAYAQVAKRIPEEFKVLVSSLSQQALSALVDNIQKFAVDLGLLPAQLNDLTVAVQAAISFAETGSTTPVADGWSFIDVTKKISENLINARIPSDVVSTIAEVLMTTEATYALPLMYSKIAASDMQQPGNSNPTQPPFIPGGEVLPTPSLEAQKPAKQDIPTFDFDTLASYLDVFQNSGLMATAVSDFLRLQKLTGVQFPAIILTMSDTKQVTLPDDLKAAMAQNGMDPSKMQDSIAKLNTTGEMLPTSSVVQQILDKLQNSNLINPAFVGPIMDAIRADNLASLLPVLYPYLLGTPVIKRPIIKEGMICAAVDCEWDDWTDWQECRPFQDKGLLQIKTRTFKVKPSCGGSTCDGDTLDTQPCSTACEPQDCVWSDWVPFGRPCSVDPQGTEVLIRSQIREARCGGKSCREFWTLDMRQCPAK